MHQYQTCDRSQQRTGNANATKVIYSDRTASTLGPGPAVLLKPLLQA